MPFLCPAELVGGHALVTFHSLVFPHFYCLRCVCAPSGLICLCQFVPENVPIMGSDTGGRHGGKGEQISLTLGEKHNWSVFPLGMWGMLNVECYPKSFCIET